MKLPSVKPLFESLSSTRNNIEGAVFVIVPVILVGMLQIASMAVDLTFAMEEQRNIHVSTDAAALAGVKVIYDDPTLMTNPNAAAPEMHDAAERVALANSLSDDIAGPQELEIQVGQWIQLVPGGPFVFTKHTNTNPLPFVNAVRVDATRTLPTVFGMLNGFANLVPAVRSIAVAGGPDNVDCLIPYGVDDDELTGAQPGDIVDIQNPPNSGNWGKLDIGGNISSLPNFIDGMINGVCGSPLAIGDAVSPATGFAGVNSGRHNGFEQRIAINPRVLMPVVDQFHNGNSADSIVVGFIVAELIFSTGHGSNWSGELRYIKDHIQGGGTTGQQPGALNDPTRVLVY